MIYRDNLEWTYAKGNRALAEVVWGEDDSICPSALICAAIESKLSMFPHLSLCEEL